MRGRPFPKGVSGNPKGRPLLNEELMQACRRMTADHLPILEKILNGKIKARTIEKIKALEVMLDRGYGKAIQPTKELQAGESYADFLRTLIKREEELKSKK